ncbi:MAG: 3-keto-5-aminohexanoate cleavage protein [Gammaproteobacteria bacterium]|nr:3-keto-5-aminohexanoate cleavage protein [Gammaproteobacteria bacterium]
MSEPIIITCAVTGSIHTPTMSPYLPLTPADIAEQAIEAAEAGAAVLHLHARDPRDGRPTADPDVFMQFLPVIRQNTEAIVNISTGGSSLMTVEERMQASIQAAPEMCSMNMGSMNFGIFPLAGRYDDWQHDWEPRLLNATRDVVFKNTFADIDILLEKVGKNLGTRFEFECYDVGHIHSLAWYLRKQKVQAPVFLQFVMGVLGGIDAAPEQLMHMKATADRLIGPDNYHFSVLAAAQQQIRLATMGAILGGNVRVGLEDSLYIARRELATSNAQQVLLIRRILEDLGYEIATPDQARKRLGLKGADKVNF